MLSTLLDSKLGVLARMVDLTHGAYAGGSSAGWRGIKHVGVSKRCAISGSCGKQQQNIEEERVVVILCV